MKIILFILFLFFISPVYSQITGNKKNIEEIDLAKPNQTKESKIYIVEHAPRFIGRHYTTVGLTLDALDLSRMPVRDINTISGLTMGVISRQGESPIFKGFQGGTAYFIDGVRVYGNIGIPGFR